jgi:aspartyl protease family protein
VEPTKPKIIPKIIKTKNKNNNSTQQEELPGQTTQQKLSNKNKKSEQGEQDSNNKSFAPRSSSLFSTATPVQSTSSALKIAHGASATYAPLNELSHLKQLGNSYGAQLQLGAEIGPSPFGNSHPDFTRQPHPSDFDAKKHQINPNQNLVSRKTADGHIEVAIKANYMNAYMLKGKINGQSVQFLLDTGATSVAIPERIATAIGLKPRGRGQKVQTANGETEMYETELDTLEIGDLTLRYTPAIINPSDKGNTALLGMSALKHFEILQKNGILILRGK